MKTDGKILKYSKLVLNTLYIMKPYINSNYVPCKAVSLNILKKENGKEYIKFEVLGGEIIEVAYKNDELLDALSKPCVREISTYLRDKLEMFETSINEATKRKEKYLKELSDLQAKIK